MYRFTLVLLLIPVLLNAAEKPDLLLITIDTLRADHLGSYGNQTIRTPNLDSLARKSLFFENAICPAPLTLPSHTSLMTGRYPIRHGIRDNAGVVDSKELTLAEILRAKGYHTYAFVGGFPLEHRFGLNQGFDVYDDLFPREKNRSLDFRSERGADAVVNAVLQTKIVRPFFLWVHFYDPHAPYLHNGYHGEIEFVDRQVGVLLRKFQQYQPVIAVAGDHGESLGEHGEWTHRIFVYDSTMKVPFWIQGPGITAERIKRQVRIIDFLPTILSILKVQAPSNLDGVLLPKNAGQSAFLESMFPQLELGWSGLLAIRNDEWKFIQAPKPELYDLRSDPGEKVNLYASKKDIAKKMQSQIPDMRRRDARATISPEMAEKLASLGYISGGSTNKTSTIDPKDRIAVWNQIEKAVDLEKTNSTESVAILEQAQKNDPDNPMILGFLAQKYAEANRLKEAKSILARVLKQDSKNSLALYRMARICLKTGEATEAKRWADILRKLEQSNADAWILLAHADVALGNLDRAAENLLTALKIDPRDDDLRIDLGNIYLQTEKAGSAREQFDFVLKSDPKNLQALNGVATCLFTQGDLTTSEAKLKTALLVDGSDPQTKMNLALLYSKQGKKSEAIALYREVQNSPTTPPDWKEQASRRLKDLQ
ncbi:sulfatase-like hydrolase/transferase [bacterium]|nr:sulfatase-like hydrolase/transferase [bacterium]MCI0602032.1 sulfatase-like hydrolase/transferase [bacterium]